MPSKLFAFWLSHVKKRRHLGRRAHRPGIERLDDRTLPSAGPLLTPISGALFGAATTAPAGNTPDSIATLALDNGQKLILVANFSDNSVSVLQINGDGSVSTDATLPTGSGPNGFAVGNFGNGHQNFAVANYYDNTVTVYLGDGSGNFTAAATLSTGSGPANEMAIGDFNHDGNPDLATANMNDGTVSVFMGNGDGTFQPAVSYSVGAGVDAITAGDFRGDGETDLAVGNYYDNTVTVLVNNGEGAFTIGSSMAVGGNPWYITSGDFTGSGHDDLATANIYGSAVSVLLSNGDDTFQSAVEYNAGSSPTGIVAADIDGDGKIDLVTSNYGSNDASVLLGNGDGTFQNPVNFGVGAGPNGIAVGDFLNQGKLDIAVANQNDNTASVLLNQSLVGTTGQSLTGVVASFTDTDPAAQAGDFSATINWGDGTAPDTSAVITSNGQDVFNVAGTHTYDTAGSYTVQVSIQGSDGSSANAGTTASVDGPSVNASNTTGVDGPSVNAGNTTGVDGPSISAGNTTSVDGPASGAGIVTFSADETSATIVADGQTWTIQRPVVSPWNYVASGKTYWVATDGNDSASGSFGQPFATIQQAANVAVPGDIVYVEAGTYVQTVDITNSGAPGEPIIITAAPGALGQVIVTPSAQYVEANPSGAVFTVQTADYVWINGFVIEGPRGQPYAPVAEHFGANGITWENGAGYGDEATNNVVFDNVHCGMKEMGHGGTNILIQGNIIFDNGTDSLDHGIYMPASNVTIDGNVIFDNTGFGIQSYSDPVGQIITRNVIFGNWYGGIVMAGSDTQVLNNTVVANGVYGILYFRGGCVNNVVEHNIFALNTVNGEWDNGGGAPGLGSPANNVDNYNDYFGGDISPYIALGANDAFVDPMFQNAAAWCFLLENGSPVSADGAYA